LDKLIIKQLQEVISHEEINNLLLGDNIVDYFPEKITRSIAIDFVIYHKRELLLYEGEIKNYCSTLPDHKEVTKVWYQTMASIVITHIQGLLECPAVQKDIAVIRALNILENTQKELIKRFGTPSNDIEDEINQIKESAEYLSTQIINNEKLTLNQLIETI